MLRSLLLACALFLSSVSAVLSQSTEEEGLRVGTSASGMQGAVAAGGGEAVAIGLEILKKGGNAADSAAATILALSVTDSKEFCFGGEVPILIYDARRQVVEVICGMGVAPKLATREYFVQKAGGLLTPKSRDADEPGGIPPKGIDPAATPAVLGSCLTVLNRYGTMRFEDVAMPTIRILDRQALDWHARLATTFRRLVSAEKGSPNDRTRGLRLVDDYFYRGPIAREISAWSEANGGLLRYSDLATHVTRIEEPASVDYRGYTVYKCGPWTQGPYVLQSLRLLEGFDLKSMGHNRPQTIHAVIEAMKLALADRDVYYADPLFAEVPLAGLLSQSYANLRRPLIDMEKASLLQRPGDPRAGLPLLAEMEVRRGLGGPNRDTTTCVVADRWGNMVAATPSGWHGVEAGETGIWLGTRLQSFNLWEGHPNCIEAGKRPRITLTPTLVVRGNKPTLAVSIAGGDGQDQAGLQLLLNHIDFDLDPVASLAAVRFSTNHHLGSFRQTPPELGTLLISPEIGDAAWADLAARGHIMRDAGSVATPVVIRIDTATGRMDTAGDTRTSKDDPRSSRHAAAF